MKSATRTRTPHKVRVPTGRSKSGKPPIVPENATEDERWALLAKRLGVQVPDPNKMLRDVVLGPPGSYNWLFFFAEIGLELAKKEPEFQRPKSKRRRGSGKHPLDESKSTPEALRQRKARLNKKIKQLQAKIWGDRQPFDLEKYWRELAARLGVDPADL